MKKENITIRITTQDNSKYFSDFRYDLPPIDILNNIKNEYGSIGYLNIKWIRGSKKIKKKFKKLLLN